MTSKALEAAVDAALDMGFDMTTFEAAEIIRAFAQNLSEEAAQLIWSERGHLSKQEAVRAAIEKDLE